MRRGGSFASSDVKIIDFSIGHALLHKKTNKKIAAARAAASGGSRGGPSVVVVARYAPCRRAQRRLHRRPAPVARPPASPPSSGQICEGGESSPPPLHVVAGVALRPPLPPRPDLGGREGATVARASPPSSADREGENAARRTAPGRSTVPPRRLPSLLRPIWEGGGGAALPPSVIPARPPGE